MTEPKDSMAAYRRGIEARDLVGSDADATTYAQPEPATPEAAITDVELEEFLELLDKKVGIGKAWLLHEDEINRAARNISPRLVERVREQDAIIAELKAAKQEIARAMIEAVKLRRQSFQEGRDLRFRQRYFDVADQLQAKAYAADEIVLYIKAVAKANGVVIE